MNRGGAVVTTAAVLAVLAAGAVFLFLSGVQHNAQTGGGTVKVIVAKQDIAVGTKLDTVVNDGGLTFKSVPKDTVVRGAVTDLSQIKGQSISQPIVAGQQLSTAFLVGSATQVQGGPYAIPSGYEAVSLSLQAPQAGGGLVQKGDHIQVFASFKNVTGLGNGSGAPVQQTQLPDFLVTVVPDVLVLNVVQGPVTAATQAAPIQITLALKPQDAEKVIFAHDGGTLWFGLLPPNEAGQAQPPVKAVPNLITPAQLRAV